MSLIVQKFGGTSVGSIERIEQVNPQLNAIVAFDPEVGRQRAGQLDNRALVHLGKSLTRCFVER